MLDLASPEIFLTLVGGIIVTSLAGLLKKLLPKINPQLIVFLLAILLAVGYQFLKTFVPAEMQASIVTFAVGSMSLAVLIYEFLWKNWKRNTLLTFWRNPKLLKGAVSGTFQAPLKAKVREVPAPKIVTPPAPVAPAPEQPKTDII